MKHLKGKRILVIDDEPNVVQLISMVMTNEGAQVFIAANGQEGLVQFHSHEPDLVLLDIMMPGLSGFDTCTKILEHRDIPIIFLTALTRDVNVVNGLNIGAVDYMTKPFSPMVLVARINAALRHTSKDSNGGAIQVCKDDYLEIDLNQRRVNVKGETVHLTATEYRLLAYLCMRVGQVVTYSDILGYVWGPTYRNSTNYVHVYISRLRKKLEPNPATPRYLHSDPGIGYRLDSSSLN